MWKIHQKNCTHADLNIGWRGYPRQIYPHLPYRKEYDSQNVHSSSPIVQMDVRSSTTGCGGHRLWRVRLHLLRGRARSVYGLYSLSRIEYISWCLRSVYQLFSEKCLRMSKLFNVGVTRITCLWKSRMAIIADTGYDICPPFNLPFWETQPFVFKFSSQFCQPIMSVFSAGTVILRSDRAVDVPRDVCPVLLKFAQYWRLETRGRRTPTNAG